MELNDITEIWPWFFSQAKDVSFIHKMQRYLYPYHPDVDTLGILNTIDKTSKAISRTCQDVCNRGTKWLRSNGPISKEEVSFSSSWFVVVACTVAPSGSGRSRVKLRIVSGLGMMSSM